MSRRLRVVKSLCKFVFMLEPVLVGILFSMETPNSRRRHRRHPPMMNSLALEVDTIQRSEEQDVKDLTRHSEHSVDRFGH